MMCVLCRNDDDDASKRNMSDDDTLKQNDVWAPGSRYDVVPQRIEQLLDENASLKQQLKDSAEAQKQLQQLVQQRFKDNVETQSQLQKKYEQDLHEDTCRREQLQKKLDKNTKLLRERIVNNLIAASNTQCFLWGGDSVFLAR